MFLKSCSRKFLYHPRNISRDRLETLRTYPNVTEIRINTRDRHTLHGWLVNKDLELYPTLIYFGGNAEEVSGNIETFNTELPANVVLFNYRGYGMSTGSPSEPKLKSDAKMIYHYILKAFSLDKNNIYVMGRSLGSGIALYLAAEKNIKKTVLLTPYESIQAVAYDHFPDFLVNWLLADRYHMLPLADKIKNKILLLVAGKDTIIPPEHAERLYHELAGKKKIHYFDNANHNNIMLHPKFWQHIQSFLID